MTILNFYIWKTFYRTMPSFTRLLPILFILFLSAPLFAEEILVTEIEDYIEGKETYTFGFAPGDKVTYTVESLKGYTDELQIIEYPAYTRYKTTKVPDKYTGSFDLPRGGFLTLQMIKLSTGKSRVKIRITRTPSAPEYKNFNTAISWEIVYDTIWKSGKPAPPLADTLFTYKSVRKIALVDTLPVTLADRYEKVPAGTPALPGTTTVNIKLPVNEKTETYNKELLQWAYMIGVGEDAEKAWDNANISFSAGLSSMSAASYASDPMAALATGIVSAISLQPPPGPAIQYKLAYKNTLGEIHVIDNGLSSLAYGDASFPKQGAFSVILKNEQPQDMNVHLTVTAAIINTTYVTETVKVPKQVIRKETIVSSFRLQERKVPHYATEPQ